MIVRVAVVPHPPILVPEVAAGGAAEIAPLRDACLVAARALAQHCPHWVAVAAISAVSGSGVSGPVVVLRCAPYGVAYHVALWEAE